MAGILNVGLSKINIPLISLYMSTLRGAFTPQENQTNSAEVDSNGHNNDNDHNNNTANQTHAHFHILPPHLLAHSVGPTTESLGTHSKVICFVLERIKSLSSLRDLVDVLSHNSDGIINLLLLMARHIFSPAPVKLFSTDISTSQLLKGLDGRQGYNLSSLTSTMKIDEPYPTR
jgi:hypothetical protein